jgi:hypothetical protein
VLWIPFTGIAGQAGSDRLRAGQTVRVRLADGQRFEAKLVGVDSNLVLRFAQSPQTVPISSIDSLWLRRRGTGRGALIGGVVVGGAAFALGALVCTALGEGDGCSNWDYVTGFGLAGGAVGALLGAGVGSLFPRWRLVDAQRVTISFGSGNLGLRAGARIRF